ncbi:MAG: HD domain-containing protein, partial [Symploca sp. SIO2G7]|nr:HD domain-containing protein [Symploca sp. SIO2G7]
MSQSPPSQPVLSERFANALSYAHQLHVHQVRKGSGIPYIAHLLSVAALVLEDGGTEDEAIAALLHDAVEDQGGEPVLQAIQQQFGNTVAAIVQGCTDSTTIPKPPWRERKETHLKHMQEASPSVLRITLADTLHNARSIYIDLKQVGPQFWTRFKG